MIIITPEQNQRLRDIVAFLKDPHLTAALSTIYSDNSISLSQIKAMKGSAVAYGYTQLMELACEIENGNV